MKIVQLYDSYQVKGGVERVLSLLLNAWADQGHAVTLLVRSGEVSGVYPLSPSIRTASLGRAPHTGRARRLLDYARDIVALRRHPAIRDADIVIANGPWCSLLSILALRLGGSALLAPARRPQRPPGGLAQDSCAAQRSGRGPRLMICDHNSPSAFGPLTRAAGRLLYRRADCIIALTQAQQAAYRAYADAIRIIPNPVDVVDHAARPAPPHRQVLALGRLSHQKGFDHLLDAWAIVIRQAPDAQLTLVGEGEQEAALHAQARQLGLQQNLRFAPFTDDVARVYRGASLLVQSSRYEGLALVLLEAQAYGLPIVAFDCEFGPREVITHGTDGLLCAPGDVQALAQGLLRLLDNEPERAAMARAARQSARRYALPTVLNQWDALFAEMMPDGDGSI